jgi:hypothetical protein
MLKGKLTVLILLLILTRGHAQYKDSLVKKHPHVMFGPAENPELRGTRLTTESDSIANGDLLISGYVSTYYAWYDDELKPRGFAQFPTMAPRNNQFSLNMALIRVHYSNDSWRSTIALHYGDIAESSWPAVFNLIQEAHAGFRIHRRLWADAGFFKTHIGLESFQPRENITSSMSIPNVFDPYFFSGAKLTYVAARKLTLQAGVFNGYNEYLDNNSDKAVTVSANYNVTRELSLTYNFLTCDETPDRIRYRHRRYYQNFFATYSMRKLSLGLDLNYGIQQHSLIADSTRSAVVYGVVLVGKYEFYKMSGLYGRLEYFSDPDRILTGSLASGRFIRGITTGVEIKPMNNIHFSIEWRILDADSKIFQREQRPANQRNEFIACLDVWF